MWARRHWELLPRALRNAPPDVTNHAAVGQGGTEGNLAELPDDFEEFKTRNGGTRKRRITNGGEYRGALVLSYPPVVHPDGRIQERNRACHVCTRALRCPTPPKSTHPALPCPPCSRPALVSYSQHTETPHQPLLFLSGLSTPAPTEGEKSWRGDFPEPLWCTNCPLLYCHRCLFHISGCADEEEAHEFIAQNQVRRLCHLQFFPVSALTANYLRSAAFSPAC